MDFFSSDSSPLFWYYQLQGISVVSNKFVICTVTLIASPTVMLSALVLILILTILSAAGMVICCVSLQLYHTPSSFTNFASMLKLLFTSKNENGNSMRPVANCSSSPGNIASSDMFVVPFGVVYVP